MLCTFFANFRNLLRWNTPKFKAIGPIVNLKKVIYNILNIWAIKKAESFQTVVLEKTLESPLDCKEIKPVNPKGNQPWIFTERTDAGAEAPILWSPDWKSWLIGKDPDAWKDWGQDEENGLRCDDWMASPTQRTWILADSGRWWRIGKPCVLQSLGSQRVRQNLATEQQQHI